MTLSNCELIPSVIYDTNDPLKLGRIKCVVPGFIDNSTMSLENMPWVRPLDMGRHQSFSKPVKGFKVWVLINKANYNEYWYIPFFEYNDISKEYLDSTYEDQPEIIISHNNGGNHAMLTYDEKNGYNIKLGQHHIELHPNGHISILGGEMEVDIDGEIKIGQKNGDYQRAVKGEPLKNILDNLNKAFNALQTSASSSPFTSHLGAGFEMCKTALADTESILSNKVKVN